ncbi:MAG: ABC transporter substrate-binding protein [Anaerotignum sp.]|jgi:peptide/nickel transport system substrate-binding protein|nr:ABC transporter substrate-binding protein [Anaerotignum sp.]MCI8867434.1 ABC transporter substrate-binding protein [Anaerotignum sp.]
MKKKNLALLLALCIGLCGCGKEGGEEQGNFFTASGGPNLDGSVESRLRLSMRVPETLNPLLNREETVDRILKLIYLPLLDFDERGIAVPAVAESWTLSEDGRMLTLQINSNIFWQNGTKLTAEDVVFSLNTLRSAPEDAVYKRVLQYVSGWQNISENTVEISFYEPFSGNISALRFPVISAGYYQGQTDPQNGINMTPMGNGPYEMLSYRRASELLLNVSDSYYGTVPQIPIISVIITEGAQTDVNAFQQGITDVLIADAMETGRYAEEGASGIHTFPSTKYDFIGFNFNRSLFQEKAVRQAVAYAFPKESLLNSAYLQYGELANTPVSPKSWLYEENVVPYNYDPTMAATVLKNNGWSDENGDGILEKPTAAGTITLQASILVNEENSVRKQIASKLKEELQTIGFVCTLDAQPYEQYQEKLTSGSFDMVVGGWQFSDVVDLTPFFATGGSYNYIGYSNEEMDRLLETARTAVGEGMTLLAYSSLQKKLAEELPYISIAFREDAVFTSKYVGGEISPTSFNVFRNIEQWTYQRKAGE